MTRTCARCGIEFETKHNGFYCEDCAPQHRAETKQRISRECWKNRNRPRGNGLGIHDVLELAPKYGFPTYEYGMIVSRIEGFKTERGNAK